MAWPGRYIGVARSLVFKPVRPLRHSSRGDAFERVQQQPVKHLTIEMLLRRNSVRNHDVKKRDHLVAFGVEDEVTGVDVAAAFCIWAD